MVKQVTPGTTRVGWIGTGVMGSSMCGHVLAAGFPVAVYNRSRDKLRPLLDKPVELVLPTHGEPADRAALERALA